MLKISPLGLGTVKFGRNQKVNYPSSFVLPSDKEILALLEQAQAAGITLLDTAPAYGESEQRLGKLLKGQRQNWIISSKAGEEFANGESYFDFSPAAIQKSVERSLKRLQTDYLDSVLIHSNGEDIKIIEEYEVFETLRAIKQAGYIRSFGMSTKTVVGGLRTVDEADVVMVTFNPVHTEEQPVIAYAHKINKQVF
ncbi:MAG TPA: aldo/keto reductase, partial [Gammaproteobacteria bacterium]|nr:aldo/keto reductase [Gammaproteobacteria bacterium]